MQQSCFGWWYRIKYTFHNTINLTKLFRNRLAFSMLRKNIDEHIHPFQKVCTGHLLWLRSYDRLSGLCAESEFLTGTVEVITESTFSKENVAQGHGDTRKAQRLNNRVVSQPSTLHLQVASKSINTSSNYLLEIKGACSALNSQDQRRLTLSLCIQAGLMTSKYC